MNSLETDLHNYKSLYEEIAQEDNNYLQNNTISNSKYDDEQCCCCNVHRRENNLYNSTVTATTTTTTMTLTTPTTSRKSSFSSYNYYDKMPIYNSIWLGEMRNATDYIEYLNKTRRNSNNNNGNASHQANKDRSNYYKLSTSDYNSLNHDNDMNNNSNSSSNFLQVPKLTMDEELRRTPEFDDIYRKISQINQLDNSVSALIYKSIEVHADILVRQTFALTNPPCLLLQQFQFHPLPPPKTLGNSFLHDTCFLILILHNNKPTDLIFFFVKNQRNGNDNKLYLILLSARNAKQ